MAKKTEKSKKETKEPASIQNRRARYDYDISETFEAGIALVGSEVKSVFLGRVNLTDAFCKVANGELWLINAEIQAYTHSVRFLPEVRRDRKLLMHKKEIDHLQRKQLEKSMALVVLAMYFKSGRVKVSVGLGRGKREFDKRAQIAKNETRREQERMRNTRKIAD